MDSVLRFLAQFSLWDLPIFTIDHALSYRKFELNWIELNYTTWIKITCTVKKKKKFELLILHPRVLLHTRNISEI